MEVKKTNAARILDKLKIKYELPVYEVDESDLSAVHVAESVGEDIRYVYKTLVTKGDKTGILVAVIPGAAELDLKAFAKLSGNKFVEMVPMKDILGLTGYIRGGCSPLGMKKNYPVFIHEAAFELDFMYVSAGVRGMQIKIAPSDLLKATGATKGNIVISED
jgi:Cys-tRNA(Pro)/Cys-tRNA(Cys) deacylase